MWKNGLMKDTHREKHCQIKLQHLQRVRIVIWLNTSYKLRVTSCELQVQNLKARVESLKARVKIQKCESISTSY